LKTKTTQPPVALPAQVYLTGHLTLPPEVPRYVTGPPDLGYYYDALDYTVALMALDQGSSITVLPGVAIAVRNDYHYDPQYGYYWTTAGFGLWEGSSFTSHGTPTAPNTFTHTARVQEQPQTDFAAARNTWFSAMCFTPWYMPNDTDLPAPTLDFRFCNFYLASEDYDICAGMDEGWFYPWSADSSVYLTLRDCSFYGGRINLGKPAMEPYAPLDCIYAPGAVSLVNNLFDRTTVNFDPTWYDFFGFTNCDMQVLAYNNLFRGGNFLALGPLPATAGHWTFTDNLFDSVLFFQETSQPLDYDYNAYRQLDPPEPYNNGGASTLSPSIGGASCGAHDISLAAAPLYQPGPLGNFYLPPSSPTVNAGSRSPAEAGLYHYTTRTDQTKDAGQPAVNIGLHYVATTSSTSVVPNDFDYDGIPDYVENWHGDGSYHSGTETKWQDNPTTTGVEDKNNAIYQDIDLDGDGMVGRIETALSKNPLVPENMLTLVPAASPGPNRMAFVVPVPFSTLAGIGSLSLRLDCRPVPFVRWDQDTSGGCLLTWDTTYEAPGDHFVQVELYLNGQTRPGAMGPLRSVTVAVDQLPYQYPLVPSTSDWPNATPSARLANAVIPQAWQTTATSWQLFISAIANPYFRGISAVGGSMSSSYGAAKTRLLQSGSCLTLNSARMLGFSCT